MLKKNAQLFEGLFTAADLLVVSVAWVAAYWVRFVSGWLEAEKGIPPFSDYLKVTIFVWLIYAFVFRRFGLYRPMRGTSRLQEVLLLVRANAFAVILFLACTYLFREKSAPFSRLVFLIFWILATTLTISSRGVVRQILRYMRRRGFNLRYAVIVGAGDLAEKVAKRFRTHPEYGIELLGCLASEADVPNPGIRTVRAAGGMGAGVLTLDAFEDRQPHYAASVTSLRNNPRRMLRPIAASPGRRIRIIGTYSDLPKLLENPVVSVDQVIVALPLSDHHRVEEIISSIGDEMVDVKIVPDYHQFITLGSLVEEFDGLPVVSIASTPLSGFNRFSKRIFDLVLGTTFFLLALPLMSLAALLVRFSSRGPVFYIQERMGLDGKIFHIYKFRTMRLNAEENGAQFAIQADPRVTFIGKILRRLSIDELPQLLNVLRGHMSLVGPRPERPVFISEFRKRIPRYMLRHKVQAGMTGWAQVNGWRGNTSIEKRIEHDLYYIENWSLFFDLKIIALTLLTCIRDENAY